MPSSKHFQACEEETEVIYMVESSFDFYCAEEKDKSMDKPKLLNQKRGMRMLNNWWGLGYTGHTESQWQDIYDDDD